MKNKIFRYLLVIAAAACAVTAAVAGYEIYDILHEYKHGDDDLAQIYAVMDGITKEDGENPASEIKPSDSWDNADTEAARAEEEKNARLFRYKKLKEVNEDVTGWIKIDGTVIDYPVMHTPDNPDFYLKHGFDKSRSAYGMIYMDENCSLSEECHNYILYGHHMKNGSMFASLEKYGSREFYEEHPVIGFDTLNDIGRYEIAAAFKMPADQITDVFAGYLAASTEEDYEKLIEYAKAHAFYDTGITPVWPEQILTLATCEYTQRDGRFFVIAKKIEDETDNGKNTGRED